MNDPSEIFAVPAGAHKRAGTGDPHRLARDAIEIAIAAAFEVAMEDLYRATRGCAATAFARQVAMYIAHVSLGLSYRETGRLFGRDRTTAAHACRIVEESREDPRVDARMAAIEDFCTELCRLVPAAGRAR